MVSCSKLNLVLGLKKIQRLVCSAVPPFGGGFAALLAISRVDEDLGRCGALDLM